MSRRALVGVAAVIVLLAGCGTRLADSAFRVSPAPTTSSQSATPVPTSTLPASDIGVTATTIRIGNIISRSNFFDPHAFVATYYGVKSLVDAVNAEGGIGGRRLELITCDDRGNSSLNVTCVRKLVDDDHVFALVGNSVLAYGGAPYVQRKGVPDIGSQPVDDAYRRYSHLWDITSEGYPRNGTVGYGGMLHFGTEVYHYFKTHFHGVPLRAAVVGYNQSSSRNYAKSMATGLRLLGYQVTRLEVNFALPDFDSPVIAMKNAGVNFVFDALDRGGNERLCKAIDDNRLSLAAKVTTTQSWDGNVRADFADSPGCRNTLFATGGARNYEDTSYPAVAAFRAQMAKEGWNKPETLSEWALEGWAGAQWFADAAASCGAALTRRCVEHYMATTVAYDGHGLLTPRDFRVGSGKVEPSRNCINVARWSDAANDGRGGWVTQVADMNTNCAVVPVFALRA